MLIEEYHEDQWAYKKLAVATGLESPTGYQELRRQFEHEG